MLCFHFTFGCRKSGRAIWIWRPGSLFSSLLDLSSCPRYGLHCQFQWQEVIQKIRCRYFVLLLFFFQAWTKCRLWSSCPIWLPTCISWPFSPWRPRFRRIPPPGHLSCHSGDKSDVHRLELSMLSLTTMSRLLGTKSCSMFGTAGYFSPRPPIQAPKGVCLGSNIFRWPSVYAPQPCTLGQYSSIQNGSFLFYFVLQINRNYVR